VIPLLYYSFEFFTRKINGILRKNPVVEPILRSNFTGSRPIGVVVAVFATIAGAITVVLFID